MSATPSLEALSLNVRSNDVPTNGWSDGHLKIRIDAAQEAIKRARFAFFLCVLAASASFVCLWNTHISWNRGFSARATARPGEILSTQNTREILEENVLKAWVESQSISINLLGIRIAVSDFAMLNSLAMYVFVYYYLLSLRRENREIGQILRDVSKHPDYIGYTVYSSISSFMVFNLNRTDDNPIRTLDPSLDRPLSKIRMIRWIGKLLMFMPLIVVLFTMVCDVSSLFVPAGFMFFSSPYRTKPIWSDLPLQEKCFVTFLEVIAGVIAISLCRLISKAAMYQDATRDVLDAFRDKLITYEVIPLSNSEN